MQRHAACPLHFKAFISEKWMVTAALLRTTKTWKTTDVLQWVKDQTKHDISTLWNTTWCQKGTKYQQHTTPPTSRELHSAKGPIPTECAVQVNSSLVWEQEVSISMRAAFSGYGHVLGLDCMIGMPGLWNFTRSGQWGNGTKPIQRISISHSHLSINNYPKVKNVTRTKCQDSHS